MIFAEDEIKCSLDLAFVVVLEGLLDLFNYCLPKLRDSGVGILFFRVEDGEEEDAEEAEEEEPFCLSL